MVRGLAQFRQPLKKNVQKSESSSISGKMCDWEDTFLSHKLIGIFISYKKYKTYFYFIFIYKDNLPQFKVVFVFFTFRQYLITVNELWVLHV